jgi:sphingosine kinase
MSGGGAGSAHVGGDRVLVLSPGVTLTLAQDALLMSGKYPGGHQPGVVPGLPASSGLTLIINAGQLASKPSRSCVPCIGSPGESATRIETRAYLCLRLTLDAGTNGTPDRIPYYNILWAEITGDHRWLLIDYADQKHPHFLQVRHAKFAIPDLAAGQTPAGVGDHVAPWVDRLLDLAYSGSARRKRAWVLVNPHAGPGGADKLWETEAKPIFEAARMPMTVVRTAYSGEAVELAQKLNIDDYDIAVPCSGDGLPHEVFNGLAKRPDARRALSKIAVCHIPCGSGNAMSCNLYGTHRPSLAALAIVKGVPTPLDLVSVTHGNERTISFLSQALGLIADLDLGTEHLRWMGAARFTYGFLRLAMQRKTYPCDIAVKVEIDHKGDVKEHYRRQITGSTAETSQASKQSQVHADKQFEGSSSASDAVGSDDGVGLPPLKYGTAMDKLPEGWELIPYEKLGSFYCGNVSSRRKKNPKRVPGPLVPSS